MHAARTPINHRRRCIGEESLARPLPAQGRRKWNVRSGKRQARDDKSAKNQPAIIQPRPAASTSSCTAATVPSWRENGCLRVLWRNAARPA